jgi:transposase
MADPTTPEPEGPPPPAGTPGRGRGAPSRFEPEIAKKVLDLLARGNYIETAAAAAGVSKVTIYTWLKRGARSRKGPFHDFAVAAEKAQAEAEVLDLARLEKMAMKGDFRAISWRLERRNARRWGPQIQVQVHQVIDEYLGYLQANLDAPLFEKVLSLTMSWDGNAVPRVGG